MRIYTVQPGDTPARIAARDDMAGCPKCSIDLVRANPHKRTRSFPNGYVTFTELREGERLNLPEKWFDGTLDRMPPSYFASLPDPVGLSGTLGDYPTLDQATTQVSVLDTLDDGQFHAVADAVADLIDLAVSGVGTTTAAASATFAKDTHTATAWARQRNQDMGAALASGDRAGATAARYDVRNALTSALGSARLCLQSFYGGPGPTPTPAPTPAPTPIAARTPTSTTVTAPVAQTAPKPGLSTAGVLGIGLLGAAVAGGAYYYFIRKPKGRVRRVRVYGH